MELPIDRASSLKSMLQREQKGVVNGLKFERSGGKAFFDRIAIHTRTTVKTERIEFQQAKVFPLQEDQPGLWQCEVPVEDGYHRTDLRLTVDLVNSLGYHSPRVKPILLRALNDKAPTLIIDGPEDELVLGDPLPLPVTGQAFDDFGVDAIGYQIGTEPEVEALREPQWVKTFGEPERSQAIKFGLETRKSGLQRDTPIFYRLLARDRKGQVGATSLRQAELYAAELPDLAPLVEQAGKLPGIHGQAVASLRALRQSVTDGQVDAWPSDGGHLKLALSTEQWGAWQEANDDRLSPAQAAQVKQLAKDLDARNESLSLLGGSLRRGGIFAIHLDLALPYKSALFQILSIQSTALMLELPSELPSHDDLRLRLAAVEGLAERQTPQFQRLQVQLSEFHQLDAAWKSSPWPPKELQQGAEALLTKGWGTYLLQEIGMVQRHLATHRHRLEGLEEELTKLAARTEAATAEQSAELEREQEAIDPGLLEELKQLSALLRPFMTPEERSVKLPAPWPPSAEEPASAEEGEAATDKSLAQHQQALRGLFVSRREKLVEVTSAANRTRAELHQILDQWDQVGPEQVERIKQILRADEVRLLLKVADQVLGALYPQFARGDRKKLREATMADLQGEGKSKKDDGDDGSTDKQHLLPKDILRRLLEGETLKGPPAYQELIDAYFRGLSDQSSEEAAE